MMKKILMCRNGFGFALLTASVTIGSLSYPSRSFAGSYDVYVDKDADSSGDGTEAEPYRSLREGIEKAASNAKGRRKVYVKGGEYAETVTIADGVGLYGAGRGKTRIGGAVSMENGSRMQNLTVDTSSAVAVSVAAHAAAHLKGVEIEGFGRIGLDGLPGNGKVVIEGSAIHDGGGKGVYMQKGRSIEIVDSRIYKNKEEGIDLREDVDGIVRNNDVYENGEGGIELVIGSSGLTIVKNHIVKNRASGIAAQFYRGSSKLGKIDMQGNVIQKNGNYGIDCKIPSGGNPQHGYWNDSLNFEGNTAEGGGAIVIAGSCKIIEDEKKEEDGARIGGVVEAVSGKATVTIAENAAAETDPQPTGAEVPATNSLVPDQPLQSMVGEGYPEERKDPINESESEWNIVEWFRRIQLSFKK